MQGYPHPCVCVDGSCSRPSPFVSGKIPRGVDQPACLPAADYRRTNADLHSRATWIGAPRA
jgi:hypothetical protein